MEEKVLVYPRGKSQIKVCVNINRKEAMKEFEIHIESGTKSNNGGERWTGRLCER